MSEADESDDQRRARGLPPEPLRPGEPEPDRPEPPKPVNAAFWLVVAAAAVLVVAFVLQLLNKDALTDTLIQRNTDENISNDQIASGVESMLWSLIVGAVAVGALMVLFAWKARQGTRSARTVVTVLVVLVALFSLLGGGYLVIGAVLLALVGAALMYLPSVDPYFPRVLKRP
ncbi:hypothetical protein [Prauserella rugosa]|uniref:DUF4064 domain-containing protein n=1 Tax=Prauserella rugosa TaxID=43354 RepID=A0A660CKA1_9PSEU|nr:hypothetical protein [Prauserella rugosa]KID32371.1 hypothetical protein HQ32_00236 [Prauserella sp. Am3]KMS85993.1 hypothetical protein ACZ91_39305 [Streptomyces regensis]TWH22053.1 hypothetical protein JD82_03926 [Prauserella rugosa]